MKNVLVCERPKTISVVKSRRYSPFFEVVGVDDFHGGSRERAGL